MSLRSLLRGGLSKFDLSPAEKLVLLALVDRSDADGVAWPSQRRLASDTGLSRSTVELACRGLLAKQVVVEHEPIQARRTTRFRLEHLA